jgi:hypothetical protein
MGMTWVGRVLTAAEAETLRADPESIWDLFDDDDPAVVDLDKAWHGIHWLLTGEAWGEAAGPAADVIMGGEEFGDNEGYGPPRMLAPAGVAGVAALLGTIGIDDLRGRFDPTAMNAAEVYPQIWDDTEVFDTYLAPHFLRLKEFYARAAAFDNVVVQRIC